MPDQLHVVCPQCQAINRVPAPRLGQGPTCGKCHAPLLPPQPLHLDAQGLERQVSKSDLPLLVDFWAEWCGPCKMMAPHFERAASMLHPLVRLAKVNTEENQALAQRYAIQSIPTLVLFKKGHDAARISGTMTAQAIADWARERL